MKPSKIFTIEEALEEVKNRYKQIKNKPIIVSVHGAQNAGKTYFCRKAIEKFQRPKIINNMWGVSAYYSHDAYDRYISEYFNELEYLFYHVGYNFVAPSKDVIFMWDLEIKEYSERGSDVNVFIFNPNLTKPNLDFIIKDFDIIISNPDSEIKKSPKS